MRQVAPGLPRQGLYDGVDAGTGAVDVIDDQQGMLVGEIFKQVLQAMNANSVSFVDHLRVVRQAGVGSANRDVIGFDTEIIESFLYRNSDRTTTAPEPDQEIRLESCLTDVYGELKRVE